MVGLVSRNPHVDSLPRNTSVDPWNRENKNLSVSSRISENLQQTIDPIKSIIPKISEHAQQGWEGMTGEYEDVPWSKGWESLNEPLGRGLGAFQYLMSPISGAYEALFDEPVSETLQQYGGMDKETADLTAMGLSVALPAGWLGFSRWAKINPFATEVLAEKLYGGTMPGTHWAKGTVDTDQTRRNIIKAGLVTAGAGAVAGPTAVKGLIGRTGARVAPIVARSAVLTGLSAGISKFANNVRKANAERIESESFYSKSDINPQGEDMESITRRVEDHNYFEVLDELEKLPGGANKLNPMEIMDDVFVSGIHGMGGGNRFNLRKMLEEAWISNHARIPPVDDPSTLSFDKLMRVASNPPPWRGKPSQQKDIPKNIEDPEVWKHVEEVRGRADMGINSYVGRIEDWDETMRSIEWYQKNDPEGLINVLRDLKGRWKKSADMHAAQWESDPLAAMARHQRPNERLPIPSPGFSQQIKLLDDLITETEALIKPLRKSERWSGRGGGGLQARLDRSAAEKTRREAEKAKKKKDGFSWLDPMGWRKHPWYSGKQ